MRALDITILFIAIQASVIFVNSIPFSDTQYLANASNEFTGVTITNNLSSFGNTTNVANAWDWNEAKAMADFALGGILFVVTIVKGVIIIFPYLVKEFSIDTAISAFLQIIIWFVYYMGYSQWRSNKSFDHFK